jgi:succinate dehydrogenase flavin-adding protein (antitoxin of CptAB toxin-antitoxin module)
MDQIRNIVNHPNFGERYRSSNHFRALFNRFKDTVWEGGMTSGLLPKIGVHVSSKNSATFSFDPMGPERRFSSYDEALNAAVANRSLTSTRMYRAGVGADSFYSGGATAALASRIAGAGGPGASVRMRTFRPDNWSDFDWVKSQMTDSAGKFYGMPSFGSDGSFQILDLLDKDGNRTAFEDMLKLGKMEMQNKGSAFKRTKVISNDMRLAVDRDVSNKLKVYKFDAAKVVSSDPVIRRRVESMARSTFKNQKGNRSYKEILQGMYEGMADGMSVQPREAFQKEMLENIERGKALISQAEKIKPSDVTSHAYKQYIDMKKQGQFIIDEARSQIKILSGGKDIVGNTRILNTVDQSGADVSFIKGNLHTAQRSVIEDLIRANGDDPSKYDLDSISALFSSADEKSDFKYGLSSYKSLDPHVRTRQANSNILGLISYPEVFTSPERLVVNAKGEIQEHIANIKAGNITPALRDILNEMRDWEPLAHEGPAAQQAAWAGKKFVRDLDRMISTGQDLTTNDMLTGQMYSAMSNHFTKYRKGHFGETIDFEGRARPRYAMNLPLTDSLYGEIIPIINKAQGGKPLEGFIENRGHGLVVSGPTWEAIRHSHGGADADDAIASHLLYDQKAKRLLAFNNRSPVQRGEYSILDADISMDTRAPKEIRNLYAEQKEILARIERTGGRSKTTEATRTQWARRLDEIRTTLHSYYSGEEVSIKGANGIVRTLDRTTVQSVDILGLTTASNGRIAELPAPKGHRFLSGESQQWLSGGFHRSFQTSQEVVGADPTFTGIRKAIKSELARERTGNVAGQLFEFVSSDYDEFTDGSGWFKTHAELDRIKSAPSLPVAAMSNDDIANRFLLEYKTRGLLGRWTNMDTLFRSWMAVNSKNLDDDQYKIFKGILDENRQFFIDAETVIDTVKKTGDDAVINIIEEILDDTSTTFGRQVGLLQKALGKGIGGIDPTAFQDRMSGGADQSLFRQAYFNAVGEVATSDSPFLAQTTDQSSIYSRYFKGVEEISEFLEENASLVEPKEKLLAQLNNVDFTPEELSRSSSLLDTFYNSKRQFDSILNTSNLDEAQQLIMELLDNGEMVESPNNAVLRQMHGMGITDPGRQLLAMAKIATETSLASNSAGAALGFLVEGGMDEVGLADLYSEGMQRHVTGPQAMGRLNAISTAEELAEFVTTQGEITPLSRQIFDPMERNVALLGKVMELAKVDGKIPYTKQVEAVLDDMAKSGQISNMNRFERYRRNMGTAMRSPQEMNTAMPKWIPRQQLGIPDSAKDGSIRFARREASDAVADETVHPRAVRTTMERVGMGSDAVRGLMKETAFRRGAIGVGILAGFGIVHRLTKDPSEEDLQGPPLLPGGSAYEGYDDVAPASMSSMYSSIGFQNQSQGMLYQIKMSGNFNPDDFKREISSISGTSVSGSIYNARQTTSPRLSSMNKLNEWMG